MLSFSFIKWHCLFLGLLLSQTVFSMDYFGTIGFSKYEEDEIEAENHRAKMITAINHIVATCTDPNLPIPRESTPLWWTTSSDKKIHLSAQLLELGADPNLASEMSTPLGHAVTTGSLATVKLLLEKGADPNVLHYEATALHELCMSPDLPSISLEKRIAIAELLLCYGAHVNILDAYKTTALQYARTKFPGSDLLKLVEQYILTKIP